MAFFVISTAVWGIRFSFGVFFKSIETEFVLSRATTSAVFSVFMVCNIIMTFVGGWAIDRYGPRKIVFLVGLLTGLSLLLTSQTSSLWQLFITYSLLLSLGGGALFVVLMSTVSRWFDKKRGFALGIASSGAGLGMVATAPFATFFITNFGWRTAFIAIGVTIWLIAIPLSLLLKKDPREVGALPDGAKSRTSVIGIEDTSTPAAYLSPRQDIKTISFWFITLVWFLFAFSFFLILTHLVPHATDVGFSAGEAAIILVLMGLTNIAGRILMGIVSDRIGGKATVAICAVVQVVSIVWLIYLQDLWALYLFSLVYGFVWGGLTVAVTRLVVVTFGVHRIGQVLGVVDAGFGTGAAIGPAIGGLIFDFSASYYMAFLIAAIAMAISTLLIVLVRREINPEYEIIV